MFLIEKQRKRLKQPIVAAPDHYHDDLKRRINMYNEAIENWVKVIILHTYTYKEYKVE